MRVVVIVLHILVGAFGLMGGYAAISEPNGPFGIPLDVLKNGPFNNFLIPGLTLFIVIGLGHILTSITIIKKMKYYMYVEGVTAAITLGWIVVQCWVMEEINGLHIAIFSIGVIQGLNALSIIVREKKYPYEIIVETIDRIFRKRVRE